jgi:hypothetical protein
MTPQESRKNWLDKQPVRENLTTEHGWPMRNDHILHLFGLPSNHPIPPDYEDIKLIGNVWVRIYPRGQAHIGRRVVAECPKCERLVCAGHLMQHMKVHNDRGASKI